MREQSVTGLYDNDCAFVRNLALVCDFRFYVFQLQRIVSRCKCEFFYAGYGDTSLDPSTLDEVSPPTSEEGGTPWERHDIAVDAFTLMHHDLDVSTNSLQVFSKFFLYIRTRRYSMLIRVVTVRHGIGYCEQFVTVRRASKKRSVRSVADDAI